jgi:hypothetical protein
MSRRSLVVLCCAAAVAGFDAVVALVEKVARVGVRRLVGGVGDLSCECWRRKWQSGEVKSRQPVRTLCHTCLAVGGAQVKRSQKASGVCGQRRIATHTRLA